MDKWELLKGNLTYALDQLENLPPSDKVTTVEITLTNILKTMKDLEKVDGEPPDRSGASRSNH